jgi:hypothetical protein
MWPFMMVVSPAPRADGLTETANVYFALGDSDGAATSKLH